MIKDLMRELVALRHSRGLRQVDVAEAMGIGQPAVSELERGLSNARLETLAAYAAAVGAELRLEVIDHGISPASGT